MTAINASFTLWAYILFFIVFLGALFFLVMINLNLILKEKKRYLRYLEQVCYGITIGIILLIVHALNDIYQKYSIFSMMALLNTLIAALLILAVIVAYGFIIIKSMKKLEKKLGGQRKKSTK